MDKRTFEEWVEDFKEEKYKEKRNRKTCSNCRSILSYNKANDYFYCLCCGGFWYRYELEKGEIS